MLLESYYEKIARELFVKGSVRIGCNCGCAEKEGIAVRIFVVEKQIELSSVIFFGNGYIPPSVRKALRVSPSNVVRGGLSSVVRERENGEVHLTHMASFSKLVAGELKALVEEFCSLVDVWVSYLDGEGEKDLIRVPSI